MKRQLFLVAAVILGLALAFSFQALTSAQTPSDSQPAGATAVPPEKAAQEGGDSNPSGEPEVSIPEKYLPSRADAASDAAATLYFTPQDENTSTTILFLYNTGTISATVGLTTYKTTGGQYIDTSVDVPGGGLVRISGDTVNTVSASWDDAVVVNFTTSSSYAKMTLPAGVKAEGYVAWNGGSTYDPLDVVPTLPLRFSIDPPTVFLPTVVR